MRAVKRHPYIGEHRTRSGFLWWPIKIRNNVLTDFRWLEKATWIEEFKKVGGGPGGVSFARWVPIRFADKR